jgi:hypothetical protein
MAGKPLCDNEILEAIDLHWRENLYSPSIQYLIDNSCIKSKNTVWLALRRLAEKDEIILLRTSEGCKAYANWAWNVLYFESKRLMEKELEKNT